jgi:hypothetical protein
MFSNQATANEELVTALPTEYFLSASDSIAGMAAVARPLRAISRPQVVEQNG